MTPEEAQELLRGDFGSGERRPLVGNLEAGFDSFSGAYIEGTPGDFALTEAAPALAEIVANLRYEYAVQVGMADKFAYAFGDDSGNFKFGPLALADWWQTDGEAADLVADLKGINPHTTACVVRRLVGEPEVTS